MEDLGIVAPPAGVTADFHILTGVQIGIYVTLSVTLFFSTLFLAVRLYTSFGILRKFELDDPLVCLSYLSALAYNILTLKALPVGLGRHIYDVSVIQITEYVQYVLPLLLTYMISPTLSKLAILLMYYRTIPKRSFRITVVAVASCVVVYTAVMAGIVSGPCSPAKSNAENRGACLADSVIVHAVLNIISDVVIIVIPMPTVYNLAMPIRQKISVLALFAIGSAAMLASIARLVSTIDILQYDIDFTYRAATAWACLELNLAVVCNCLIRLQPFIRKHFPQLAVAWNSPRSGPAAGNNQQQQYRQRRKPRTATSGRFDPRKWGSGRGGDAAWEMQSLGSDEDRMRRATTTTSEDGGAAGGITVKREFYVVESGPSDNDSTEGIIKERTASLGQQEKAESFA